MSSGHAFINHRKNDETVRIDILTNVCRMLVLRGRLDITKYCKDEFSETNFADTSIHLSSAIDDSKFKSMIGKKSDKNLYIIDVDTPFDIESGSYDNFDGTKLIVSLIPHKITDIKNSEMITDVFKVYPDHHKIFIIDSIVERAISALTRGGNVEVFVKDDITIDLMSHYRAPHRCILDKKSVNMYIISPNVARMHENDHLAKYYNAKVGDTLKIIGNTVTNGFETRYRMIIEAKSIFGK